MAASASRPSGRRFWSLALVLWSCAALTERTAAWWDNGHELIGEIASVLLQERDRSTLNALLSAWEDDFPGTSELATAAVWCDLLRCNSVNEFCASPLVFSLPQMEMWHFTALPMHVNGSDWQNLSPDSLQLFRFSAGGDAVRVIEQSLATFRSTKSHWAANFALRNLLHLFGDIHQPSHVVNGISAHAPNGDFGGSKTWFTPPCSSGNLHQLWDSAGNDLVHVWAPDIESYRPELTRNATELIASLVQIPDRLDFDRFLNVSFDQFLHEMVDAAMIKRVALDSYAVAKQVMYQGLDLEPKSSNINATVNASGAVPCPSAAYFATAAKTSKQRVALAGKRLAVLLTHCARQIRALGLSL